MYTDEKQCDGVGHDGRSMWYFGLNHEDRMKAMRCRRRKGHRGPCSVFDRRVTVIDGEVVRCSEISTHIKKKH